MADLRRTALIAGAGAGITGNGLFLTALAWASWRRPARRSGSPRLVAIALLANSAIDVVNVTPPPLARRPQHLAAAGLTTCELPAVVDHFCRRMSSRRRSLFLWLRGLPRCESQSTPRSG